MILKSLTPVTTHDANKRRSSSCKSHIGVALQVVGAVPDPVIRYLDSKLCTCEPGETRKSDLEPFLTPNPVLGIGLMPAFIL
jgi:hypothetical protein